MYILQSFLSLNSFKFFLFEITLYLMAFDRNRTITWRGSSGLEFLGLGSRWLTSISPGCRGGSSSMMSLVIAITAWVVSSFSFSGIPDIRRLFLRPYCSRASWTHVYGPHLRVGNVWTISYSRSTISLPPGWCGCSTKLVIFNSYQEYLFGIVSVKLFMGWHH